MYIFLFTLSSFCTLFYFSSVLHISADSPLHYICHEPAEGTRHSIFIIYFCNVSVLFPCSVFPFYFLHAFRFWQLCLTCACIYFPSGAYEGFLRLSSMDSPHTRLCDTSPGPRSPLQITNMRWTKNVEDSGDESKMK